MVDVKKKKFNKTFILDIYDLKQCNGMRSEKMISTLTKTYKFIASNGRA